MIIPNNANTSTSTRQPAKKQIPLDEIESTISDEEDDPEPPQRIIMMRGDEKHIDNIRSSSEREQEYFYREDRQHHSHSRGGGGGGGERGRGGGGRGESLPLDQSIDDTSESNDVNLSYEKENRVEVRRSRGHSVAGEEDRLQSIRSADKPSPSARAGPTDIDKRINALQKFLDKARCVSGE
jgi:hypothetical protein